jgi:hypothetical protein
VYVRWVLLSFYSVLRKDERTSKKFDSHDWLVNQSGVDILVHSFLTRNNESQRRGSAGGGGGPLSMRVGGVSEIIVSVWRKSL